MRIAIIFAFGLTAVGQTVWNGVYTEAQAGRGKEAFTKWCMPCHGEDLRQRTGHPLVGDEFVEKWREQNLDVLFNFIRTVMPWAPESGPGVRPPDVPNAAKLDALSYILKSNGMPAGSNELTAELAAKTLFVSKEGPKPPPNLSHVIVTGCLTAGPNKTWVASRAPNLIRSSSEDMDTLAEPEQAMLRSLPSGNLSIRLTNLETLPNFQVAAGKRIAAKGIYYASGNRVNATAAITMPGSCE